MTDTPALRSWNERNKPRGPASPDEKKKPRYTRQRAERMKEDAVYLAIRDTFLENNPICAEPGCGKPATRYHHIANGANRALSLTNTDLGMAGCDEHGAAWDDKGAYPIAKQLARKFLSILRRYAEITGKRVCVRDVIEEMKHGT